MGDCSSSPKPLKLRIKLQFPASGVNLGTMASGELKGKTILKPPPHGRLLQVTQKLKRDVEEIQLCAAQALGFHTASVAVKIPEALTAIIQKVSAIQANLGLLDEIRTEMSALYSELRSTKAQLRSKEESADLLPHSENVAELSRSFPGGPKDAEDASRERCAETLDALSEA